MWDEITYPFPNFNSTNVVVSEWRRNFVSHFTGHMITYPCWDVGFHYAVWNTWLEGLSRQKPRPKAEVMSSLRPEGHVFHTAWDTMIKSYYSTLADWLFSVFIHRCSHKYEFYCFKISSFWFTSWLLGKTYCCYGLVAKEHKWIIVMKTWIPGLLY